MAPPKPVEPAKQESTNDVEPSKADAPPMEAPKSDLAKAGGEKPSITLPKPKSKKQEIAETLDADLPKKFGRLTLLRTIARGGMGEVFLATAGGIEGAERPCVVKIIRREHAADPSFLARFFDEARIQAQLDHPGVARVVEAATDPSGKPFVVVEYIEGRNLAEVRNRGSQLNATINWAEAVAVGVAMAEALSHVHERTDANGVPLGIVHRDLSPQNVMVGYTGDVKLIDFGTARGENRRCHTVSGVVLAKPGYVAPEVANSQPGGVAADLYAVGIILWELVAGRRFLTGEPSAHVAAVASGKRNPPPIAELVKAPAELDTLIALLTAPRIEDRMPSARQAASELVRILKKAPSLANGERGVRARIANVMQRLYPAEPAKSRAELGRLLALSRSAEPKPEMLPAPSPPPGPADESLLPGTRYRILREIGRGAMGVVFEATHLDLGRVVALKVLPKERCASTEHELRFRNEARASAKLRHPNLVGLHDFGVASDGRPYYAMEMLEGETLERHLERERGMDWREAIRVGLEMCAALECAHEASLIHRDIKPGNVFLTRDGKVKLLDFGLVLSTTDKAVVQDPEALKLNGTVEYMAPEQAAGETVDERADLYAVGAVLYELVTGRLPHVAPTALALIDRKLRTMPESACERAPGRGIPRALDQVIMKALSRYPTQRYKNATEMRAALDAALLAPAAQRRTRRLIAAAALASAATLVTMFAVKKSHDPAVRERAAAMLAPTAHKLGLRTFDVAATPPSNVDAPVATLYDAPKPAPDTRLRGPCKRRRPRPWSTPRRRPPSRTTTTARRPPTSRRTAGPRRPTPNPRRKTRRSIARSRRPSRTRRKGSRCRRSAHSASSVRVTPTTRGSCAVGRRRQSRPRAGVKRYACRSAGRRSTRAPRRNSTSRRSSARPGSATARSRRSTDSSSITRMSPRPTTYSTNTPTTASSRRADTACFPRSRLPIHDFGGRVARSPRSSEW
ncbi:MAG TPA: serine/threonine-protein kinase [Polyangiaceae bacterium]|nr:serine/threonine-protein kinase [Polyangiaceae bacterium]